MKSFDFHFTNVNIHYFTFVNKILIHFVNNCKRLSTDIFKYLILDIAKFYSSYDIGFILLYINVIYKYTSIICLIYIMIRLKINPDSDVHVIGFNYICKQIQWLQ